MFAENAHNCDVCGGILFFLVRKRKVGIVVALLGIVIAILPFAVNIWLAHG